MAIKSALGKQLGTQFDSVFDVVKSNPIYDKSGGKIPSLDLNFAKSKSFRDSRRTKNKITFSRASSGQTSKATFVGSDGLIKTTPVNLYFPSVPTSAAWGSPATFTETDNYGIAPDGTTSSLRITATDSGYLQDGAAVEAGKTYTFSAHIKLEVSRSSSFRFGVQGTAVNSSSFTDVLNELIVGEWVRVSHTFVADNTANVTLRLMSATNADVEFWGVQLEEGSTATAYIPTTTTISGAPRFEQDPVTGESLGLLIEESSVNYHRYSTNFANWTANQPGSSYTPTTDTLDPTGGTGAYTLYGQMHRNFEPGPGSGTSNPFRGSVFVKRHPLGQNTFQMFLTAAGGDSSITINFDSETIATGGTNPQNPTIQKFPNGWYRIGLTITPGSTRWRPVLGLGPGSNRYWYVYGCQLEKKLFDTSYIPTSGSSVTRAADVAEITGANFAKTNSLPYSERLNEWTIANNTKVTPNAEVAPDGTLTADRVLNPATGSTFIAAGTINAGTTYTISVYAKAVTPGTNDKFTFNLGGSSANASSQFTATSEWQRFSFTITPNSVAGQGDNLAYINNQGDQFASDIYFWGAQLEESDVLTDYTPSVETFDSRGSIATFVDDATGLIKTTPVNLLTNSQSIENWTRARVIVNSDNAISPIGDQTADTVIESTDNNTHHVKRTVPVESGKTYTASVFVKAAGRTKIRFGFTATNFASATRGAFDLDAGTAAESYSTITNFGNGWYRITTTNTATGTGNVQMNVDLANDSGSLNYAGDGTSGIILWGGQIEEGSTATDYIRTTSKISGAARFENNQLILEESRTNFALNSDSAQGGTLGSSIINSTENVVTPRGITETVRRLGRDVVSGGAQVWRIGAASGGTPNTTYTISFYAKTVSGGTTTINIDINDLSPLEGQETTITGEWTRIIKTGGNRNSALRFFDMNMRSDTTEEFYVFGAQIEAGDFATSYIPTDSTPGGKTRATDVSTSALGVDSFHNQSEGTLFVEALNYEHPITGTALVPISYSDNSFTNLIQLGGSTGSNVFNFDTISSGSQSRATLGNYSSNKLKSAGAYKVADQAGSLDGAPVVSASPSSIPSTINRLDIGNNHTGGLHINGHVKRFAYFNTRLSDDKLKSITA